MEKFKKFKIDQQFFCGGNSEDPLNLESICPEDFNKCNYIGENQKSGKDPLIIPSVINVKNPLNLQLDLDITLKSKQDLYINTDKRLLFENYLNLKKDPIVSPIIINKYSKTKFLKNDNKLSLRIGNQTNKIYEAIPGIQNSKNLGNLKYNLYRYGNYPTYYNYRNMINSHNNIIDTRLSILQREWVKEKKVLDIGCNTGFVTKYIAKHLNPSKIIGYDIDNNLIKKAKIDLLKDLDIKYHKKPNIIHNTSTLYLYPTYNDETKHKYPYNIDFITANYVCECQEILKIQRPEFDIIICLSVSKWIHLNWGDNGLKITFQRIYEQLNDNGIFFFEPQEWMSYKKAKKKTKLSFTHLNFKPNQFKSYLLNEVGFSYVKAFYPQKSSSIGFERTLYVFLKAEKGTITEHLVKELNLEGGEYTTA